MAAVDEGLLPARVERTTLEGHGGVAVEAIHARPEGEPVRGLVVHPDIGGVRPLFDDICRRLATHGMAVCAPEPWARIPEAERAGLDVAARMARMPERDDDAQLGDLAAAAEFLRAGDGVQEVAVLGFCMGGMYALKAAATGAFDRAVVYYGMIRLPEGWHGPRQGEPLAVAAGACPTLAFFGDADPWTPAADVEALRAVWADHSEHEIVVYRGADHGFVHDPSRPAHRPADAADTWRRTLAFLGVP
ncbi:MAG TPA: dienelactone hydrolase family protein [Acidimicrobiia bacterium]